MIQTSNRESGFSMAELLVAMVLGMIIIALIIAAYMTQTNTNRTQQMVVARQQTIRSGLHLMEKEIMVAGYEEEPFRNAGAGFLLADPTDLQFTYVDPIVDRDGQDNDFDGTVDQALEKDGIDNDGDGDIDEQDEMETVRFRHFDSDGDGVNDAIAWTTGAAPANTLIAEHIQQLEFFYTLADGTTTTDPTPGRHNDIKAIGISLLARTEFVARGYTDDRTYARLSGQAPWGPYDDGFQRQLVTATVWCRNMMNK